MQNFKQLGNPGALASASSFEAQECSSVLPVELCVSELATAAIGAAAIFPEAVASPVFGGVFGGYSY